MRGASFGTKVPNEFDPKGKDLGQIALRTGTAHHKIAGHLLLPKCREHFHNTSLTVARPV